MEKNMRKNKDTFWMCIAAVALVFTLGMSKCRADLPADVMRTPSIEFSCKGLRDVVFYDNGDLSINNKTFKLRSYPGSLVLEFDNKVYMSGKRDGDNLMLDNAVIIYEGQKYQCRAE